MSFYVKIGYYFVIMGGYKMDQKKIGSFIAACRKEHNMTQVQFAEQLGVTNKAVSKWETGGSHS